MTLAATAPTSAPARIEALDALRGLALCGILFVNLPAITGMNPSAGPWLELLAHQRFFPVFSFLFGLGTALFLDGAARRTVHPRWLLLRRLVVVGVVGAGHQLLQPGEALLPYAVVGIVVLLPASWLPRPLVALGGAAATVLALALTSGGLALVPGLFLLGYAAARYGVHHRLAEPNRAAWAGLLALVALASVPLLRAQQAAIADSGFDHVSAVAGLVVAVGYVCVLVLALASPAGPAVRWVLAPLGRMALTNYLSATLLVLAVWRIGGVPGPDSHGTAAALACAVLVVQLLASRWWLRHFSRGPAEWLWHTLTWWTPARARGSRCLVSRTCVR